MSAVKLPTVAATLLLLLHGLLLLGSARANGVTIDEAGYIPSGLSHWQTGSFAAYRVNPPLPRMLAVQPVLLAGPDIPPLPPETRPDQRLDWDAGPVFVAANAARYVDLVFLARLAGVAWSLLGGWIVYRWANELYGGWAGCLSLGLWCFGPNILAHAAFATPDLPAAAMGLTATYVFWRYLRAPSWSWAWFAGLLLGVAQLTKFTLLLLYGVWPLLAVLYWIGRNNGGAPAVARRARTGQLLLAGALSLLVLNLGYGFQGTGRRLGDFHFVSRLLSGTAVETSFARAGNRFHASWLDGVPVPLPADYLLGIDRQRLDFEGHWPSYFRGEWRDDGRWYFYLYALTVKVPLGALVLALGGLLFAWRPPGNSTWRDEVVLWLPVAAILALVSGQTGLNYFRYALPLLPFAVVAAGKTACFTQRARPFAAVTVVALLGWTVCSSLLEYPHSLAYFNEAAGGPQHGHEHLLDSNLDWGQDLPALKVWLDGHPEASPIHLAYFGRCDPRLLGIEFRPPAVDGNPEVGYYAVSVHLVCGGSFAIPDGQGGWRVVPPHGYEYFRRLRPIGRAGRTIWIYSITEENLHSSSFGAEP